MGSVTLNYIPRADTSTTITGLTDSNIYFNTSTQNVGIGTTDPIFALSVAGVIQALGAGSDSVASGPGAMYLGNGTAGTMLRHTAGRHFAIDTYNSSNVWVERIRVLRDGNVGIGTATPNAKLHVMETGLFTNQGTDGGKSYVPETPILTVTTDGNGTASPFYSTNAVFKVGIGGASAGTVTTEHFRVNLNGNVGIGTTNPTGTYGKLTVAGGIRTTDDTNSKIELGRYSAGAPNSYIKLGTNSKALLVTNAEDNLDLFIISGSGNVGIGTTNPSSRLTVANTTNVYTDIQGWGDAEVGVIMRYQNGGNGAKLYYNTPDAVMYYDNFYAYSAGFIFGSHDFRSKNSGGTLTSRLFIRGDTGNVGIGTTNPGYLLDVNSGDMRFGTTATGDVSFRIGANSTYRYLALLNDSNASGLKVGGVLISDSYSYASPGRNDLIVKGNVGIGTTNPGSYKLQVNGTMYSAGSSLEYKQDITHYDVITDKLLQLQPVTYHYKPEYEHLGKKLQSDTQIGLIAEQVAEIFPELAVMKEENGQWMVRNVDYEKLSILLLSEVQKLRKEVNQLHTSLPR